MRPLFYHYEEQGAYDQDYEYLLGRDILVSPVIKEEEFYHEVYLPDDQWVHLFTGDSFEGGTYTVFAPVGTPAVFIRKDSPYADQLLHLCCSHETNGAGEHV